MLERQRGSMRCTTNAKADAEEVSPLSPSFSPFCAGLISGVSSEKVDKTPILAVILCSVPGPKVLTDAKQVSVWKVDTVETLVYFHPQ